jgi:hypothetical protein
MYFLILIYSDYTERGASMWRSSIDYSETRQQMKQNILRNIQHNDCSLVQHTLLFEDYLFQTTSMTFDKMM